MQGDLAKQKKETFLRLIGYAAFHPSILTLCIVKQKRTNYEPYCPYNCFYQPLSAGSFNLWGPENIVKDQAGRRRES